MANPIDSFANAQLHDRRERLESAIAEFGGTTHLARLLQEVDLALERIDKGSYGLCEACQEPIEKDRLLADPLVRLCIDHLTSEQQRALEQDLELASRIQATLLPKRNVTSHGWEVHYYYEPAGPVSGDYCDVMTSDDGGGGLYFLLGDVAGKGVAASLLMSHLHAIFRSLMALRLPVAQLAERANRVFCESTMATSFATLICGKAGPAGEVELCNAGHCHPILLRRGEVTALEATGLPLGMFSSGQYEVKRMEMAKGDSLLLYTDGLIEARNASQSEYSASRLQELAGKKEALAPQALAEACLEDLRVFLSGSAKTDDLTIMVLRRVV